VEPNIVLSSMSICVRMRTSSETLNVGSKRKRMLTPAMVRSRDDAGERGNSS
jgi:hypothetical protein